MTEKCIDWSIEEWMGHHFCNNPEPSIGATSYCDELLKEGRCPRGLKPAQSIAGSVQR